MADAAAQLSAHRQLDLILVERDPATFERLKAVLASRSLTFNHGPFQGAVEERLDEVLALADGVPLFAFLDPYGLGLGFRDVVGKIMGRPMGPGLGTEVLLNFSADAVRRIGGLLTTEKTAPGRDRTLAGLDAVCGGSWWRDIYVAANSPQAASDRIAHEYLSRLCTAAGCRGWAVPVQRAPDQQPVYTLVYLTRHDDGIRLFGEAVSKSLEDWRRAVAGSGTLDDEGFFEDAEAALAESWHAEIVGNLRRMLATGSPVHLGNQAPAVYGAALGEAREKHLRRAVRELHRSGEIAEDPKGQDLWRLVVHRTT